MKNLSAKVLVIGGGPAGSIAARTLAEAGVETLLIERNLSFKKPCGGGTPSSAFDEMALPKNLIKKRVETIKVVSPKGREAAFGLKGGYIAIVERGEFDSALREEAKKAGAEVMEAGFLRFAEKGDAIIVSEAAIGDEAVRITSEYVIASDGVGSRALSSLAEPQGMRPQESVFTLSARVEGVESSCCEFWLGSLSPGYYSWVFPTAGGVSAGTGSPRPENLRGLIEAFLKRRGLSSSGSLRGYRIPIWDGKVFNKGNVLFAGDSAGQVMPFTFEGIYYSMKSGFFAAQAVSEGRPENYSRLWKARFGRRFGFMKRLWRVVLKNNRLMEKFVSMHQRPSMQEATTRLWLDKSSGERGILSYMKLFAQFIR